MDEFIILGSAALGYGERFVRRFNEGVMTVLDLKSVPFPAGLKDVNTCSTYKRVAYTIALRLSEGT